MVVITELPASVTGDEVVLATPSMPMSTSGFLKDLFDVYVNIVSNPVTLVLFVVATIEILFLIAGLDNSVFIYVSNLLVAFATLNPTSPLATVATSFSKLFIYLYNSRSVYVFGFLSFIPFVLGERDLLPTVLFTLFIFLTVSFSYLERYIFSNVWLVYNNLTKIHKLILLLLFIASLYLQVFDFTETSVAYTTLAAFVKTNLNSTFSKA